MQSQMLKIKKITILIITCITLLGCKANYNIHFDENTINDSIKIYTENEVIKNSNEKQIEQVEEIIADWQRGHEFYKRELFNNDKITGYTYKYNFEYSEYDAMSEIRKCYDDFNLQYDNNKIKLKTSNIFLCSNYYPNIEEIKINISSKYKIVNSNADIKKDNTHTWTITKNNYNNKPIIIEINKESKENKEKTENKNNNTFKLIFIIIFFIAIIFFRKIKK